MHALRLLEPISLMVKVQRECKAKSSFFNWWYFGVCAGASVLSIFVVSYKQDNLSWALGFRIPCMAMVLALVIFLLGTTTYMYSITQNDRYRSLCEDR
ncbi:Proton-dependent oligopeptide transporter family [Parasponia andersonii]|uniref:Proton-dependent oligopeptide transporter family n=1 Tax=Parasponia andersonii TaxID=3476 RepID=A0A2P5BE47_PARAD|nr:Proton-dependent oligopeptide transporter family [Parasponia andersonii]